MVGAYRKYLSIVQGVLVLVETTKTIQRLEITQVTCWYPFRLYPFDGFRNILLTTEPTELEFDGYDLKGKDLFMIPSPRDNIFWIRIAKQLQHVKVF